MYPPYQEEKVFLAENASIAIIHLPARTMQLAAAGGINGYLLGGP